MVRQAILVMLLPGTASAQLLCTMPNGVVITKNIGNCPADATLVRKTNGDVVRSAPLPKPTPQQRPAQATTAAPQPAAPQAPPPAHAARAARPEPTDYDTAQVACKAFKQSGASECTVDTSVLGTSYINTTIAMAPHLALVTCKDVAASLHQATRAFAARNWEIRIYSPFSGNRPIASCEL